MNVTKTLAAALALAALGAAPARPQTGGDTITLGGQIIMRIRTGAGGYTAVQRAEAVRERLVEILSQENLRPADVTVRQTRFRQDASIYVRDRLLITVDRTLSQANGNGDPAALANNWAQRLRNVLPQLRGPKP